MVYKMHTRTENEKATQKDAENEKEIEEDTEHLIDLMRTSLRSSNVEPFDLSLSKEEIREQFTKRLVDRYYFKKSNGVKTKFVLTPLKISIAKSYLPERYEEAKDCFDLEYQTINSFPLFEKFFNDISNGKKYEFKTNSDVKGAIADVVIETLQDACGNVIYIKDTLKNFEDIGFKRIFHQRMYDKGYQYFQIKPTFAFTSKKLPVRETKYQDLALSLYKNVVNEYSKSSFEQIFANMEENKFEQMFTVVEALLNNIEARLSEKTKSSHEFMLAKKQFSKFMLSDKSGAFRAKTVSGRRGQYYDKVLRPMFERFRNNNETEEDVAVLKDFYQQVINARKALMVVDSNGRNFPVNYFKCSAIKPYNFVDCVKNLCDIQKDKNIIKDFDAKSVDESKRLVRSTFNDTNKSFLIPNNVVDSEVVLSRFKGVVYENKNGRIDLSTEEGFQDFVKTVDDYIEKNSLPRISICVDFVGQAISKCREPLNMPNLDETKEVEEEKIK